MRYMLMIFSNPENWAVLSESEVQSMHEAYMAFTEGIRTSGEMVSGEQLTLPDTASVVRVRDASRTITDGPFIESKEVLAGFYVVDVPSLDRALELAAQIPDVRQGAIEVRPVVETSPA